MAILGKYNETRSKFPFLFGWRRRSARLQHIFQHSILQSGNGFVFYTRKIEHSTEMRNMTCKCISSQIGSVLPFTNIRITRSSISQIPMLHLSMISKSLVHIPSLISLYIYIIQTKLSLLDS